MILVPVNIIDGLPIPECIPYSVYWRDDFIKFISAKRLMPVTFALLIKRQLWLM